MIGCGERTQGIKLFFESVDHDDLFAGMDIKCLAGYKHASSTPAVELRVRKSRRIKSLRRGTDPQRLEKNDILVATFAVGLHR